MKTIGNLYCHIFQHGFLNQLEFQKLHFENYREDGNVRSMCIKLEIHKWEKWFQKKFIGKHKHHNIRENNE